jgi:hypothetical protein
MTVTQLDKQMESEVVLTALTHLTKGEITDVIACFAERFEFNDRGAGTEVQ